MADYSQSSFTANESPLSESGNWLSFGGSTGLSTDANGEVKCSTAGWQATFLNPSVEPFTTVIYAEFVLGTVGAGASGGVFSPAASGWGGLGFARNNSNSILVREYYDAEEIGIYGSKGEVTQSLPEDTIIGVEITDNAAADTSNFTIYIDDVSVLTGTIEKPDATTLQPGFMGINDQAGTVKSILARDTKAVAGNNIAGDAVSQTTATGDLDVPVNLSGSAVSQSTATGDLTDPSIDDVNGNETIVDGQTGNTLTTTETDPVTVIKLKSGTSELSASNITGGAGSYNFDIADISAISSNTPCCFFTSASHQVFLEVNNGIDDIEVIYNPKPTYAITEIQNPIYGPGYLFEDFTPGSVSNGCQVLYSTANDTSIGADGEINTNQVSGYLDFVILDVDDNLAKPYSAFLGYTEITGAAVTSTTASGSLSTGINLNGVSAALSVANGQLTTQITFAANAISQSVASGTLDTGTSLSGNAVSQSNAVASLTTQISLSGAAVSQALSSANLVAGNGAMFGGASAQSSATGDLSTGINLGGVGYSVSEATGDLVIEFTFNGDAVSQAISSGSLTTSITLDGQAIANALATGSLGYAGMQFLKPGAVITSKSASSIFSTETVKASAR